MVLILEGNSEIGAYELRKEQSLLFDLFKAFDYNRDQSQIGNFFSETPYFLSCVLIILCFVTIL